MSAETPSNELSRRTIVVTGATSGIGRAVAERLLADGARVVGVGRDFEKLESIAASFQGVTVDLAELSTLATALDEVRAAAPKSDALVCCAGFGKFGSLEEFSLSQIEEQINVNLTATIATVRCFLPQLKARGGGNIVVIGSESGLRGGKMGAVYSATKFGLRGFTQALRQEVASAGVRVTLINPGMVRTPFFDQLNFQPGPDEDNYLLPEEIAEWVTHTLSARPHSVVDEINLSPMKRVVRKKGPEKT